MWPYSRTAVKPIAIVLTVLSVFAMINSAVLGIPLAAGALVYWLALKNEKIMLMLITPNHILKDEEKDLEMFATNPRYRELVVKTLREKEDKLYDRKVSDARRVYNDLTRKREEKLTYLREGEWISDDLLRVNKYLGQVLINNDKYYFSSIKGAEVTTVYSQRIEQFEEEEEEEERTPSIGGAVVGGLVGGWVGAAVGAAVFSKKSSSGSKQVRGRYIPTCSHIGVKVSLDGFVYEIPVLRKTVDQGTPEFARAMTEASRLVDRLHALARTPVPEHTVLPEEDPEILALDAQISSAGNNLETVISDKPAHKLPAKYFAILHPVYSESKK